MSLRLLGMLEATAVKSHQHDCLNMRWSKTRAIDMLKVGQVDGVGVQKALTSTKNCRHLRMLKAGEIVCPSDKHSSWFPNTK